MSKTREYSREIDERNEIMKRSAAYRCTQLHLYAADLFDVLTLSNLQVARCSIDVASAKYTDSEIASTIVVMSGDAMTAGSNPIFAATSGSVQPTSFAKQTTRTRVMHTMIAILSSRWSRTRSFTKLVSERVSPQRIATRISFQIVLKMSPNSTPRPARDRG